MKTDGASLLLLVISTSGVFGFALGYGFGADHVADASNMVEPSPSEWEPVTFHHEHELQQILEMAESIGAWKERARIAAESVVAEPTGRVR